MVPAPPRPADAGSTRHRPLPRASPPVSLDLLLLALVISLSAAPYVGQLGFYSDDWSAFAGPLSLTPDASVWEMAASLYENQPNQRMRPLHLLYMAALFRAFGSSPLGYHLVNAGVLVAGVVLFHLTLRELRLHRWFTLGVPLVYGLLPHYSTARFWPVVFVAVLSMALYFLGLYAHLRAVRRSGPAFWAWMSVSAAALVVAILGYELFLPLFVVSPVVAYAHARRVRGSPETSAPRAPLLLWLLAATVLPLVPLILFKIHVNQRLGTDATLHHLAWFADLVRGAVVVSFGDFGLALPRIVGAVARDASAGVLAAAVVATLVVFAYVVRTAGDAPPAGGSVASAFAAGLAVFLLGYTIFLSGKNAQNSPTGISNRIAVAAAIGVACCFVAAIAWVAAWLPAGARRRAFAALVATVCGSGFLIVNGVASYWAAAYQRETEVLADLKRHFPTLPPGTTLILDGVCPYVGPAIVFESTWDLAGALMALYGDYTLKAHPLTRSLTVGETGLTSSLYYGVLTEHYPYERMIIYHAGRHESYPVPDAAAARRYLRAFNPDRTGGCPPGLEGHGVATLPTISVPPTAFSAVR